MNNTKIYIGNLPYKLSEAQLADHFNPFGDITDLVIIKDRETGRSKGFGFITYGEQSSAQEAVHGMNEKDIEGKKIVVSMAKPQKPKERGGRSGGGFGGGRGGFGGGRDRY